jgi:hypothetical protein
MAEENFNSQEKGGSNLPKGKNNRAKFSFYWIYAGLLLVFIMTYIVNWQGGTAKKTNWGDIKEMLENGDVSRIVLVNKETAEIYLKPEKLDEPKYKDLKETAPAKGPQFTYNITSPDSFERQVDDAQKNITNPVYI